MGAHIQNRSANCAKGGDECKVVSSTRSKDCCSLGCTGDCASGASVDTIAAGLAKYGSFAHTNSAVTEAQLQTELSAGRPVARITTGHIDVVTGCGPKGYTVVD